MRNPIYRLLIGTLLIILLASPLQVEAAKKLIPMGQSIGVALQLSFVYVAHDVLLESGSWLKGGMIVEKVDEQSISSVEDVTSHFNESEKTSVWTVRQNGQTSTIKVLQKEADYLLPFLKDKTDGIGTLTFIDPETKQYGALGHQIIDEALKEPPKFSDGSIFLASIHQIKKSVPGKPGYKMSIIAEDAKRLGNVKMNSLYGIFGKWEMTSQQSLPQAIEIMQNDEISIGDAKLYTAIEGSKVEMFTISITEVSQESIKFEVTDQRLLKKTGGILQGMSGSPIVQNGQFVGAVTHMYVDEPEKGAAIPLIEMLKKTPK